MSYDDLLQLRDHVWLYGAAPLLALAALVLTIRLRAPQWRRLGLAFSSLRDRPEDSPIAPGLAAAFSGIGGYGAAAAVGAATAVSLGGAGVLLYLWVFGILLAPVRYAETLFSRTDAPGRGDAEQSGSLARRLVRMEGPWRVIGFLSMGLVLATAFAFGGSFHATALSDAAEPVLPGSGLALVAAMAGAGAVLVVGGKRTVAVAGWLALLGIAVLLVASGVAIVSHPGASFGVLAQAFGDAFEGARQSEAFGGALAGEVVFAALIFGLPPLGATTGADGAIQAESAGTTRRQAALSMLGPLIFAALSTVLCMAFVGTGAHGEPVATNRALPEAVAYRTPAETLAQRLETERRYEGYIRLRTGIPRNPRLTFGTERGMIEDPRFEYNGEVADLALQVADGKAFRIMRNQTEVALGDVDETNLWRVRVHGMMAPTGGTLIAAAHAKGGDFVPRIALAALMALAGVAFAFWGFAVRRVLPASVPPALQTVAGLLPAAGAALALTGWYPGLPLIGTILAGLSAALAALVLTLRAGEISKLDG